MRSFVLRNTRKRKDSDGTRVCRGAECYVVAHRISHCTVDRLRDLGLHTAYVPKAGLRGFHVCLCDEIDTASDAALKHLLSKLDSTERNDNVIWIFTCNSLANLDERFQSRCLKLDFNSYGSSSEIVDLLARIWTAKAPSAPAPNFKKIAVGNIRESLQRLEIELLSA